MPLEKLFVVSRLYGHIHKNPQIYETEVGGITGMHDQYWELEKWTGAYITTALYKCSNVVVF